jgi:serine/threonine-protein kinase
MTLIAGTRLGPYEIVSPIGAGGMGEVYRARDGRLQRDVAIKVLSADFAVDPGRLRRFEQEARAVAALSHPNILAIYDTGQEPAPFLVTELLEGETLRALLDRGPLSLHYLIDVAGQIAAGLVAAHARGIVHRDLKPANLFLTRDGVVKLLDFGLAKTIGTVVVLDSDPTQAATIEGTILGTVGYMSPEQVRGDVIDHRTDIFACGAILYEMTTGQRAFRGGSAAETMSAVLREEPSEPSAHGNTPPALLRIIRRCLEKNADLRFQSARDLKFAVESMSGVSTPAAIRQPDQKSVAVIPFTNMSADPENEYFSDGLAEELTNALARLPGLRVASRTSAFRFRGRDFDIRDIGRQLNVDTVLEGSVRRIGKRLRITAQLVNAADGYHLWSERYDREMADVFDIQDDITTSIVKTLEPALLGKPQAALRRHTDNPQAYELYLKGRHFWYQRTERTLRAGIECFEGAIDFDPQYALAYAGLADSHTMLRIYLFVSAAEGKPLAEAAAKKAMELDATLSEAQYATALYTLAYKESWNTAEAYYARALELAPQSAMILANHGVFLATSHRFDEAAAAVLKAIELDPLSPFAHGIGALALYVAGRHVEAVRHAERALDLHPDFVVGLWPLGLACCALGQYERAIQTLTTLVALSRRAVLFSGMLGFAYGRAGRRSEAQDLLDELDRRRSTEYVSPFALWMIHFGLGELEQLYTSFDACLAEGDNGWHFALAVGPFLDELASDPRSTEYLRRFRAVSGQRGPDARATR